MKTTISADVWEAKRGQIANLYKDEEWPLKQVIKRMRSHDFNPTETQLRSRLKKWGVTKPSRQRRKKPLRVSRPEGFGQHLEMQKSRGGGEFPHETTGPDLCDPARRSALWGNHRRWTSKSPGELHIPNCAFSGSQSIETLMTPSCGASFTCLNDYTLKYLEKQPQHMAVVLNPQHDAPRPPYHAPSSYKPRINDQYGSPLRSELTSPIDVPAYEFFPNVLSGGCGSPDSSHFQVENQRQTPPLLSSPITQPPSPWGYPTPNVCHDISPTIYPKDGSATRHTGHVAVGGNDRHHDNCLAK